MKSHPFDELRHSAADDGGSHPLIPVACRDDRDDEVASMMAAWTIERDAAIEAQIVLKLALGFIKGVWTQATITEADRRKARKLIQTIGRTIHS